MTANAFPARAFPKRAFPGRAFPAVQSVEDERPTGGWLYRDELPWLLRPLPMPAVIEFDGAEVEVRPDPAPKAGAIARTDFERLARLAAAHPGQDAVRIATALVRSEQRDRKRRALAAFNDDDELLMILVAADLL